MKNSYSIGEFSQVTGLSVKTPRFYHEKGILTHVKGPGLIFKGNPRN